MDQRNEKNTLKADATDKHQKSDPNHASENGPAFGRNATAQDVANLAGVSRWTVARAFKRDASISEKNLNKVLAAAKELGYAPDLLASSLAGNKTHLVALLIDDFDNPYKLPLLKHLTDALQKKGLVALLINIGEFHSPTDALLNASQRRADAAIVMGTGFSDELLSTALGAQRMKKLIVFARESSHDSTISISCDNEKAIREIVAHALKRGFEKTAFLAGPITHSTSLLRKRTFARELKRLGKPDPYIFSIPTYSRDLARQAVLDYLGGVDPKETPDLLLCENDVMALGAIDAIRYDLGLSVPDDIAVIGFDNIDLGAAPAYDLTSYEQPLEDMVEHLLTLLDDISSSKDIIRLPGQLIIRTSG
ncbi:MAG: LacI family DNA-binding transcriptional regulator [Cohaesibacter sp.]|nr:LacI family DNA-binding transcriptional regulator [Cohaesibacter sp.]